MAEPVTVTLDVTPLGNRAALLGALVTVTALVDDVADPTSPAERRAEAAEQLAKMALAVAAYFQQP